MIRNVLEHIPGIGAFPALSLVIFVLVFLGIAAWVFSMSRSDAERAGRLPLENDGTSSDGDSRHEPSIRR